MQRIRFRLVAFAAVAPTIVGTDTFAQSVLDRVQPIPVEQPLDKIEDRAEPAQVEVATQRHNGDFGQPVFVGGIAIAGLKVLGPADFSDILTSRVGQTLNPDELESLTNDIAARLRSRGFVFGSVCIEAQQLDTGILTVTVDEGRIDEIEIKGSQDRAIRAALAPLASGRPITITELERRLLLAADLGGVRISNSRYIRRDGKGVLVVVSGFDKVAGRATIANDGTRPLGPVQVTLQADVHSLVTDADSLLLTWSATPAEMSELQFGRIRYERRLDSHGTDLAATATFATAAPGSYLGSDDIRSHSWSLDLSVTRPLLRRRNRSVWFQVELAMQNLRQTRLGTLARDERVVTGRLALYGYSDVLGGRLRAGISLTQRLGILGASSAANPLASRPDVDGSFTVFGSWAEWTRSLNEGVSLRLAMQGQMATRSLPVSQELGLGGSAFLRGYDWFERSGDDGIAATAELRYTLEHPYGLAQRAQVYAFFDGGAVSNHDSAGGGGSLASLGSGVRADLTRTLGANIELALPLSGLRYDSQNQSPKINFRIQKAF